MDRELQSDLYILSSIPIDATVTKILFWERPHYLPLKTDSKSNAA